MRKNTSQFICNLSHNSKKVLFAKLHSVLSSVLTTFGNFNLGNGYITKRYPTHPINSKNICRVECFGNFNLGSGYITKNYSTYPNNSKKSP